MSCALASARSTVAIRSSTRVPVNVISNVPVFLPGHGLVLFLLGRSGKTPPQILQNLYPARLTITAPGARRFLRGKPNLGPANSDQLKLFRRRASWRCATADCDLSHLRRPSPASWSAAGTSPASRPREAHP